MYFRDAAIIQKYLLHLDRNKCQVNTNDFSHFMLKKLCIDPKIRVGQSQSWAIGDISFIDCIHADKNRRMSCLMVQDLIKFMKAVEREFRRSTDLMRKLKPKMTLVGSTAEGTRGRVHWSCLILNHN